MSLIAAVCVYPAIFPWLYYIQTLFVLGLFDCMSIFRSRCVLSVLVVVLVAFQFTWPRQAGQRVARKTKNAVAHGGVKREMAIPVMILVGDRVHYLRRVLDALGRADGAQDRLCFLVGENVSIETAAVASNLTIRAVSIQLTGEASVLTRGLRLKHIWFAAMHSVWDSEELVGYTGSVVFLEDDVVPSPDFFTALEFGVSSRRRLPLVQVTSMGGWGGENQINANASTFTVKICASFPTMGYAFDASLWAEIHAVEEVMLSNALCVDWAECLSSVLHDRAEELMFPASLGSFHQRGAVKVIQPTLSRTWHIGVTSQVGSVHNTGGYKWPDTPSWERVGGGLMSRPDDGVLLPQMRDVFGFPSRHWQPLSEIGNSGFPPHKRHDIVVVLHD
jgi:hypothetical protein